VKQSSDFAGGTFFFLVYKVLVGNRSKNKAYQGGGKCPVMEL
jgi:hypothetical protein